MASTIRYSRRWQAPDVPLDVSTGERRSTRPLSCCERPRARWHGPRSITRSRSSRKSHRDDVEDVLETPEVLGVAGAQRQPGRTRGCGDEEI
jgi:hypothetical protein